MEGTPLWFRARMKSKRYDQKTTGLTHQAEYYKFPLSVWTFLNEIVCF